MPRGPGVPTTSGSGRPGANKRPAPASGSQPPAVPVPPFPTMTVQAVAASAYPNSSITSQKTSGASGVPPTSAGVLSQNAPMARSVATVSPGSARSFSARSPAASNSGRRRRMPALSPALKSALVVITARNQDAPHTTAPGNTAVGTLL